MFQSTLLRGALVAVVLALVSAGIACEAFGQDDVAGVPAAERKLDANLQYFLIGLKEGAQPPAAGYKLLVVLPGGDGSQEFQPFVKRIYQNSLSEDYLVVQLVAPKWSPRQRIVWPTKTVREPAMKVSTEEFIAAAVTDVQTQTRIDAKHVYALGWSSGGPAVYTASLTEGSPLTGAFVAMSVFNRAQVRDLSRAKGRAYYILHSKDDKVCPYRLAEQARDQLGAAGATVNLVTYEGGHGWQGDVFGNIRAGVKWLEEQTAAR